MQVGADVRALPNPVVDSASKPIWLIILQRFLKETTRVPAKTPGTSDVFVLQSKQISLTVL